jgi:thiamine biosynthesis lipoprotein
MTLNTIDRPRTLHAEECMGTVFTVDIRDPGDWRDAIDEVVGWLHHVDAVFSTCKDDSVISRLRRGELTSDDLDDEVTDVLTLCSDIEGETDGYFTMSSGARLDPTGVVKGWAIERAGDVLRRHGSHNHAVNGGGDIQLAGEAAPGQRWTVGVTDPCDNRRLLTTVAGRGFAIATSGVGERGLHILNPYTGAPAAALASITVVGESLTRVDAYATAAFAMGGEALGWIESLAGYEAFIVRPDHTTAHTSGFHGIAGRPNLVHSTPPGRARRRARTVRG